MGRKRKKEKEKDEALKHLTEYIALKKKKFLNVAEKIIVYVRVSSFASVEMDNSIPKQKEVIKNFILNDAYLSKFIVNGEYTDDVLIIEDPAESGLKFDKRPGIVKIRKHIKRDNVTHLLVFKIDRLGRSIAQNSKISAELKKNGVHLISAHETLIDTRKGDCEFYFTLLSMFAQMEIDNIKERTSLAMAHRMELGYAPPGKPTFGFVRNGDLFEHDEFEAKVVETIFTLAADGLSNSDIRDIIYAEYGNSNNDDLFFSTERILRTIRNPIYKGIIVFNNSKRNKRDNKPKEIVSEALFDGIVSEELWKKANDTRKTYIRNTDLDLRKGILTGKIKCPLCGDILQSKNNPSEKKVEKVYYRSYICKSSSSKVNTKSENKEICDLKKFQLIY